MTWTSYVINNPKSGESGTRSRANNQIEPLEALEKDRTIHIYQTGLTYDQAVNMLSLTPEICRFTSEIEYIFGQFNILRIDNIVPHMFNAYKRIIEDRADREKYGYTPLENYLDYFVKVKAEDTGKYLIFRKLTNLFEVRRNGTIVDLKKATLALSQELISMALENQIVTWKEANQ